MVGSRTIGIYGSLQRAYSRGLRVSEYYARPDMSIAKRVSEEGIKYVPVVWVPEAQNLSQGVVNVFGERRLFAFSNSGCISNLGIRDKLLSTIEDVATKLEVDSVILDAIRFPSPHDGLTLFSCFCNYCQKVMKDLGIDPEKLKLGLRKLIRSLHRYPYVELNSLESLYTWIRVRQHIVRELLKLIREKSNNYGLKLWAAIFPPSLAWLVGQNYTFMKDLLDEVHVMLYHRCGGAACLNHEVYSLAKLISRDLRDPNTLRVLRMLTGLDIEDLEHLEYEGLGSEVLVREFINAKNILGGKAVPVFQLSKEGLEMTRKLRALVKVAYLT